VIGRAKNSARDRFCFAPWGIRAGFESFGACENIYGSKPARFNPVKNECYGRAEFFALPITCHLPLCDDVVIYLSYLRPFAFICGWFFCSSLD
jgi:uncharacterized membrane protein